MIVEEKFDALYNAANKAWGGAFEGWEWEWYEDNVESKKYVLGEKDKSNGFAFFLAGCRDIYGGLFWLERSDGGRLVLSLQNLCFSPLRRTRQSITRSL